MEKRSAGLLYLEYMSLENENNLLSIEELEAAAKKKTKTEKIRAKHSRRKGKIKEYKKKVEKAGPIVAIRPDAALSWQEVPIEEQKIYLSYLMTQYGLTPKQAAYVAVTFYNPQDSQEKRAQAAGYAENAAANGETLKSEAMLEAIKAEGLARKRKIDEFSKALEKDARGALAKKLQEHAEDATTTPNQTRAVELIGKIHGVFVDRVELDPGQHTRSRFMEDFNDKLAGLSGEKG